MKVSRQTVGVQELATELSGHLRDYRDDPKGIVLGLPHNGLVLASILGRALHIPAQVFIVQEVSAPCLCPCTIGAVTETNVVYLDERVIAHQSWLHRELRAYIEKGLEVQRAEIARQLKVHRSVQGFPELTGRNVLLLNDGTASSAAWIASIQSIRRLGSRKIVAALATDSLQFIREIEQHTDELIVVTTLSGFPSGRRYIELGSPANRTFVA